MSAEVEQFQIDKLWDTIDELRKEIEDLKFKTNPNSTIKVVVGRGVPTLYLSKVAYDYLGVKWDKIGSYFDNRRDDPSVIGAIELFGEKAFRDPFHYEIIEIPANIRWHMELDAHENQIVVEDVNPRQW